MEILHLSDMQLRCGDPKLLRAQIAALRRLPRQPDLVCVTGDVCERVTDAPLVAELLHHVQPRLGTYLILGNHEYAAARPGPRAGRAQQLARVLGSIYRDQLSSGAEEGVATADALERLGLRVLCNAGVRLHVGGRSIWLGGLDDGWAMRADVPAALRGRTPGEPTLMLVHEPELAFPCVEAGADLVLAGHTHGGQVRLPGIGALYAHRVDARVRVDAGLQQIGGACMHISAGMGQLVPLRFGCPPEVVWLTLAPRQRLHRISTGPPTA